MTARPPPPDLTQAELFQSSKPAEDPRTLVRLQARDKTAPLSKAQKQFNKWIATVQGQRADLAAWQDFLPTYPQRLMRELDPLRAKMREEQINLVRLLDAALADKQLTRLQAAKATELLLNILTEVLEGGEDKELIGLYDKHSEIGLKEVREEELQVARDLAEAMFGIDLDPDSAAVTPEALAREVEEKVLQREEAKQARAEKRRASKKTAKQQAREATQEQAAEDAGRSMRDIYRKLVSELHPDREPDAAKRAHKTGLMQKLNEAYAKKDLLRLLELQLEMEQIDVAGLAGIAEERLLHYVAILQTQSQRLREELATVAEPFAMMLNYPPAMLKPAMVEMALRDDVLNLKGAIKAIERDLVAFRDVKNLKNWLKHYRFNEPDDDDIELMEALIDAAPMRRRRRK